AQPLLPQRPGELCPERRAGHVLLDRLCAGLSPADGRAALCGLRPRGPHRPVHSRRDVGDFAAEGPASDSWARSILSEVLGAENGKWKMENGLAHFPFSILHFRYF